MAVIDVHSESKHCFGGSTICESSVPSPRNSSESRQSKVIVVSEQTVL